MKELPKELTPELLSLVMGVEVKFIYKDNKDVHWSYNFDRENSIAFEKISDMVYSINIDTLTRLMKEWCLKQDYELRIVYTHNGVRCGFRYDQTNVPVEEWYEHTEFEAILKATHWVAKEKGLLGRDK